MGGSQVYLAHRERFTVEELLAALAIHSANDAAVALAEHTARLPRIEVALPDEPIGSDTAGAIAAYRKRERRFGLTGAQLRERVRA